MRRQNSDEVNQLRLGQIGLQRDHETNGNTIQLLLVQFSNVSGNERLIIASEWDEISDVFVNQLIFRDICWIKWTRDHQLAFHSSTEQNFNYVNEILLCAKTADEFGVIRSSAEIKIKTTSG